MRHFLIYLVVFIGIGFSVTSCLGEDYGILGRKTAGREIPDQKEIIKRFKYYHKTIKDTLPFTDVLWEATVPGRKVKRFSFDEKFLYIETDANLLHALKKYNGHQQWQLVLDNPLDFPLTPIKNIPEKEEALKDRIKYLRKELADEETNRPRDEIKIKNLRLALTGAREYFKTLRLHDFIYFISKGTLYSVDRNTGSIAWRKFLDFVPNTAPAASFTAVYINALDFNRLYQFDTEKRYAENFFRVDDIITTPPVYEDPSVYFGSADGKIYSFHTLTGKKEWVYQTEKPIKAELTIDMSIDENTIYVGSTDFAFYAIDRYSGALRWKYETGHPITTKAQLARRRTAKDNIIRHEHTVFFRADQDALYALALVYIPAKDNEGNDIMLPYYKLKWKFPEGKKFLMYGLASCYVLGMDKQTLYALDIETGRVKEKYSLEMFPFRMADPEAGILYLGTRGHKRLDKPKQQRDEGYLFGRKRPKQQFEGYIFAVKEPPPKW